MPGFYDGKFSGTDDASWGESIGLYDNDTNQPLADAADADFNLEVSDCGTAVLTASFIDGVGTDMTKPNDYTIQWLFSAEQMAGLCPGTTYAVGLTMTTNTGKVQLLVGSLAVIDGGF